MTSWSMRLDEARTHLISADPILAEVIYAAPLPDFQPHTNYYQALVESIISQRLSVKAAASIVKKFVDAFEEPFPTPAALLSTNQETLRSVGLSRQKTSYLYDLAEQITQKTIRLDTLNSLSNDEIINELTKIKGIGVWTVHMFLIFCMGRLDILPTGDLGIKNGVHILYGLDHRPNEQELADLAHERDWHPYESVASWYIWRSLNNKPAL